MHIQSVIELELELLPVFSPVFLLKKRPSLHKNEPVWRIGYTALPFYKWKGVLHWKRSEYFWTQGGWYYWPLKRYHNSSCGLNISTSGCPEYSVRMLHYTAFRWSCKPWEGEYNTYWPAGGGRRQNLSRTGLAQGLNLYLKYGPRELMSECYTSQGRLTWRTDSGRCAPLVRPPGQPPLGRIAFWHEFPWAVFSGFCPRPPPAGQYVLIFLSKCQMYLSNLTQI